MLPPSPQTTFPTPVFSLFLHSYSVISKKINNTVKMQFTISAAAFLAFAAKAFAQTADFDPIFKPEAWQSVAAGQNFQITWDAPPKYAGQKVTISLIGGETQNTQVPIKDIASE